MVLFLFLAITNRPYFVENQKSVCHKTYRVCPENFANTFPRTEQ